METGRFWPICSFFAPEMVKFGPNFCYCAVNQDKAVFQWKRAAFGPSICCFGARSGQIWSEFLLLCCRPRKGRFFNGNGPFLAHLSALLEPKMVKFGPNFCYCAVGPRKGRFSMETGRFWPICPFGARNGQICIEFLLLCSRPRNSRFSMKTGRFWAHLPFWSPKWSNFVRISAIVL